MTVEEIMNDEYILDIYKRIYNREAYDPNAWAFHGLSHVENVTKTALKIMEILNCSEEMKENAKIAIFLHDVGCIDGKEDHEIRGYEIIEKHFKDKEIKNKEIIFNAVKNHRKVKENADLLTKIIVLSDKLDITKNRITEAGKLVEGNRQYANIEEIKLEIIDDCFVVNFITNNKIDIDEFLEFYFTKKVFKAIENFSNDINLKNIIKINNIIYMDNETKGKIL